MGTEIGDSAASSVAVSRVDALTPEMTAAVRALLWAAFGDGEDAMTEDDWQHAAAGVHFVAEIDGEIVAYASVARWRSTVARSGPATWRRSRPPSDARVWASGRS